MKAWCFTEICVKMMSLLSDVGMGLDLIQCYSMLSVRSL